MTKFRIVRPLLKKEEDINLFKRSINYITVKSLDQNS